MRTYRFSHLDDRRNARFCATLLLAIVGSVGIATSASAQDDQRRFERQLRQADLAAYRLKPDTSLTLGERTQIDAGGYVAATGVWLQDSDDNFRRLFQPEASVYARGSLDGVHDFFIRARFAYRDYSSGDSFDGRGDSWNEPFVDRYWYDFNLKRYKAAYNNELIESNFSIRIGRQFIDWGASLVLSDTLYAVRPVIEFNSAWRVELLAGITPEHTTDFDSSRADYDDKTRRGFYGGRLVYSTTEAAELYAYYLYSPDNYGGTVSRSPIVLTDVQFETNSHYAGLGTTGSIDPNWVYQAEIVGQFGTNMSDPLRGIQREDALFAGAGRAQLTYVLRDPNQTRFQIEMLAGSGDGDRLAATTTVAGNQPGTQDHSFQSLGFANTGLAFGPSLANLGSLRIGGNTHPFGNLGTTTELQIGVDAFVFNKIDSSAPIDEPTVSGSRFLGGEVDFYLNWRLTSDLSFNARYGVYFPGEAILGSKDTRYFVSAGLVLSF